MSESDDRDKIEPAPREPFSSADAPVSMSFWRTTWRRFRKVRTGMAGLLLLLCMFAVAFFAPVIASNQPIVCKLDGEMYFPGIVKLIHNIPLASEVLPIHPLFTDANYWKTGESFDAARGDWGIWPVIPHDPALSESVPLLPAFSSGHYLGTDDVGRDVMARLIYGAIVSMKVGFISMGIATVIGLILGALAGYFGGWIDIAISRVIEMVMCFPTFFLILAVLAWLPPRIENVMIVIGCTRWVSIARYTRGEFLKLREFEYVTAARALGAGPLRIIFRHILPNSLAPVVVSISFGVASAILIEAGLSWLGFGVQPPNPSWGNILQEGYQSLSAHMIIPACCAIFVAVLSFNLVGDALRDVSDPRLRTEAG